MKFLHIVTVITVSGSFLVILLLKLAFGHCNEEDGGWKQHM